MEYFSNLKAKLIYVFCIPDATHRDCVKIGEATFEDGDITLPPNSSALNKAARARIDQDRNSWEEVSTRTTRYSPLPGTSS